MRGGAATSTLATALLAATSALSQEPPPPPDLGAPEGAVATRRVEMPFDRYALPVGTFTGTNRPVSEIEGRVIRAAFRLEDPAATTASVIEGYHARLAALGFVPIFDCATEACGGLDFRFGAELISPPAMLLDAADFAQISARGEGGATRGAFASVLASRAMGAVHVQTVLVLPASSGITVGAAPDPIPEPSTAPSPTNPAAGLVEQLRAAGHVRLDGLVFEPGGAALSDGSAAVLDGIAAQLGADAAVSVVIVGHSDNQGPLDANIALSRKRAETVRDALVARGIDAGRLDAQGIGYLAPVASNASDDGRARNRRVELVLK